MTSGRYRFASFDLDVEQGMLFRDGAEIYLRPKPLALLGYLVARSGRVVGKDELLQALWPRVLVTEDSLTRCVSEVRAALGETGHAAIRTMSRRGYLFTLPVTGATHAQAEVDGVRGAPPGPGREPIGRADDLDRLRGLLESGRWVTITGPGGVGKSCLAQWLLHERRHRFAHGAGWVDLANVADPDLIPSAMGTALGVPTGAGAPLATLLSALQPLSLAVVLDNAEHLAPTLAGVAQAIHDVAPGVQLLVTSQIPLRATSESVYRLDALQVPEAGAAAGVAMQSGAMQLFIHRATAADARFSLDDAGVRLAADICRSLAGLPLSIELAASRAPTLGLVALAQMLDERFLALSNLRHGVPRRQQSLHAAIGWSFGLLEEDVRQVFCRLAVFPGPFDLESAQAVAPTPSPALAGATIAEQIGILVDRSLVTAERGTRVRYRLLQTTRAFAKVKLSESGELESTRSCHAKLFERRLRAIFDDYFRGVTDVETWRTEALGSLDDGRLALEWAAAQGDADGVLALAASMSFILSGEQPQLRRRFLDAAAPWLKDPPGSLVAAHCAVEAAFAVAAAQPALALRYALPAVPALRSVGDLTGLYRALAIVIYCEPGQASPEQHAAFAEMRTIERHDWPSAVLAQGAHAAACWYSARGDFEAAIERRRTAYALYERSGHRWQTLVAHANLMDSLLAGGYVEQAIECGQRLEARLRGTRQRAALPAARLNLVAALLACDDVDAALPLAQEGWPQGVQLGWQPYWADYLALLTALQRRPGVAARVLGYADARYAAEGTAREVNEERAADRATDLVGAALGSTNAARLRKAGMGASDFEIGLIVFDSVEAT